MGPQDTYVVKMEHLVTRTRVRGELAPSPASADDDSGCERAPEPQRAAPQCVHASHILVSGAAPAAGGCGWAASPASSHAPPQTPAQGCGAS